MAREPGIWIGLLVDIACVIELLGAVGGAWHIAPPVQKAVIAAAMAAGLVIVATLLATMPGRLHRLFAAVAVILSILGISLFAGMPLNVASAGQPQSPPSADQPAADE